MENLGFGLDEDSAIGYLKQTKLLVPHLIHAFQCTNTDCRLSGCQQMKRRVHHSKSCKEQIKGRCTICKQLIALYCFHGRSCLEAKCSVPFCMNIKLRLWRKQAQQISQQARILKRHFVTMQNRGLSHDVLQPSPEDSNSSCQPSFGSHSQSSSYRLSPGIDMSSLRPSDLLQFVQQLQAKAKTQFGKEIFKNLQHLITAKFGINDPVVNPPVANAALMSINQQIQMQKSMLQMASLPNHILNMENIVAKESEYAQNQNQFLPNP